MFPRVALLLLVACLAGCATAPADPAARAAVARSLPLLQHTMDAWFEERTCTSCHHHSLAVMALTFARERGFAIDDARLAAQVARLGNSPDGTVAALQLHGGINPSSGRSMQLLALASAAHPADERTDAMAHLLAAQPGDSGEFWSQSHRPPLEDTSVSSTAMACRALQLYGPAGRSEEIAAKVCRGRDWLLAHRPIDSEERSMRLFGLAWTGADQGSVAAAAAELLAQQHGDGGWSQLDGDPSDAYATGQAMVALQQVGGLPADAEACRRGARFLLDHQCVDGSWLVRTRRRAAGLEPFETGFPHGEHQFISCAATAWAVMALAASVEPRPSAPFHGQPPGRAAAAGGQLPELHRIAAFGTAAELQRALDAGADVNARGPGGLTPLHLAVHDAGKVQLLLARGALVDARTELGNTTLLLAAGAGNALILESLLAAGADLSARDAEGCTALMYAVTAGDEARVRLLLGKGASVRDTNKEGATPLHLACWQADVRMARLLLAQGADGNARVEGSTPLQMASIDGLTEVVTLLLQAGVEVDAVDTDGMTALAWAARTRWGHGRIAAALLAAGADPLRPAKDGHTPLDWARIEVNAPVLALLP